LKWEECSNVKDVQAFLGFANFYHRFIHGFSRIVAPPSTVTKKVYSFSWDDRCHSAFKEASTSLYHSTRSATLRPHPKGLHIETDASDYVYAGSLSQLDDNGILHPIAFFSKKHTPAECNYEIYDKELLAIVRSFEECKDLTRHYV